MWGTSTLPLQMQVVLYTFIVTFDLNECKGPFIFSWTTGQRTHLCGLCILWDALCHDVLMHVKQPPTIKQLTDMLEMSSWVIKCKLIPINTFCFSVPVINVQSLCTFTALRIQY